jgi:ABC-2 type transport system ATP-binding protein
MIVINDLTFWYSKQKPVFSQIDLNLESGRIFGLMGKNGAGKTTLLKLISGLSFPKSGTVTVDGRKPADRNPGFLADLFFVPEEISLPPMTPEKFALTYQGFYPAFDPELFRNCLEKFEVDNRLGFQAMSHGQRKKAMIAFSLAANTRYLFLDEPAGGLDIPSKAAFRSMIAATFSEERTIILSTHMVRDLESLIDSVIILENHRIVLDRHLEEVALKLSFGRSAGNATTGDVIFSARGELGPVTVSVNTSGVAGNVDFEALFTACISVPDKISSCFKH